MQSSGAPSRKRPKLISQARSEARLLVRGKPGEAVELIEWTDFVTYLDELRTARRMKS